MVCTLDEKEHLFSDNEYDYSNCGRSSDALYKECPHCGADMSGRQ